MDEREMLCLIQQFLVARNLHQTVEALEKECRFDLSHGGAVKGLRSAPLQQILDQFHEARLRELHQTPVEPGTLSAKEKRQDDAELQRRWNEGGGSSSSEGDMELDDVLPELMIPNSAMSTLCNLHSQNPLCVRFNRDLYPPLVATGGADKLVTLADSETGDMIGSYTQHKAGILSMDFHPVHHHLLLTGSMDAHHAIIDSAKDGQEALVGIWHEHSKFVVQVKCKRHHHHPPPAIVNSLYLWEPFFGGGGGTM